MQEGIKAFVEDPISGLGSATINPPVKFRPKVGIQLMELLIQETPITFIPCGN